MFDNSRKTNNNNKKRTTTNIQVQPAKELEMYLYVCVHGRQNQRLVRWLHIHHPVSDCQTRPLSKPPLGCQIRCQFKKIKKTNSAISLRKSHMNTALQYSSRTPTAVTLHFTVIKRNSIVCACVSAKTISPPSVLQTPLQNHKTKAFMCLHATYDESTFLTRLRGGALWIMH